MPAPGARATWERNTPLYEPSTTAAELAPPLLRLGRAAAPLEALECRAGVLAAQIVRFLSAGGLAVAAQWATLILLVELDLAGPVRASSIGFMAATSLSYVLRRRFVFRTRLAHRYCLPRYALIAVLALGLTAGMMALGTGPLHLPYLLAQLLTSAVVTSWNFVGHRRYTFRRPGH